MSSRAVLGLRCVLLSAFPVLVGSALVWKFGTGAGRASIAQLVECADRLVPPREPRPVRGQRPEQRPLPVPGDLLRSLPFEPYAPVRE